MDNSRIGEAALVRLLEGWCTDSRESLHRQLAAALTALISSGELPPGTVLPSERSLATALAVSRGTLVTAYTTLRSLGLVDSRQGSGTRVRGVPQPGVAVPSARLVSFTAKVGQQQVDLSSGALPGQDWVADVVGSVGPDELRSWVRGHGYHPAGLPPLREALARQCTADGLPTQPEQVLVTSGSQQALQLVAGALIAPGDEVLVEDPTYRGALEAFRDRGARLRTIPLREDGLDAEVLVRLLRSRRPRLLYLLPAVHNPVGVTLRPAAAKAVAEAVADTGTTLLEDLSTVDTLFSGPPPTPMASLVPEAPVLTIGSLSKLFWGGIRIGWVRSTAQAVRQLVSHRSSADLGSSVPSQLAALRLLDYVPRARRVRARELRTGYLWITELLAAHLPDWSWVVPDGGASLWVRLPGGNAVALAESARRGGVLITPGPAFSAIDGQTDRVRLSYAVGPDTVRAGVERLAVVWRRRRLRT
ncbi:PLP-dependent aminotransferase family protein [Kutzneria albida]|uniref:HTH gntR-type domain-containing protein n=1 Tax=Kutzneria albida DSM 43870 TaxID=1449976 RepID=W5WHU0_9PSEU|nr:PLP-dependent aminotransferase family protein [Kutzneria albida]AHI00321.1 hypothetical protein KALB_6962 [Kutzneria albida DSM 43870]